MDPNHPVMLRLISSSVSIASRAGAEIRRITKSGQLDVVDKGVQDYQTEADRMAQRLIVASISKHFPRCNIVGEEDLTEDTETDSKLITDSFDEDVLKMTLPEQYRDVKEEDITVWVDPLDGTTEFVKGGHLDHVTVLIGISVNGSTVSGIINQPFYGFNKEVPTAELKGRTMWALIGLGCFGIEAKPLSDDRLLLTTTASHGNANIEESIASIKPDEVHRVGGAGHKVLLVAEGKAHAYVFPSFGCKRWDTSAPGAILACVGGQLTDVFGNQIEYNLRADENYQNYLGVVASANAKTHRKIIESIPEDVRNRLKEGQCKGLKSKF